MKRTFAILTLVAVGLLLLFCVSLAHGDDRRTIFCAGFSEGYKSVKGKNATVPFCPYLIPQSYKNTVFQLGIDEGRKAAGAK